jgi:hypothetical protein
MLDNKISVKYNFIHINPNWLYIIQRKNFTEVRKCVEKNLFNELLFILDNKSYILKKILCKLNTNVKFNNLIFV